MERVEVLFDNSGATVVIDASNEKVSKAIIHLLAAISDTSGNIDAIVNQVLEFQKQKNKKAEVKAAVDSFNIFLRGGSTVGRQHGKGVAERFLRDFTINLSEENKFSQNNTDKADALSTPAVITQIVDILKSNGYAIVIDPKSMEPYGSALYICNAVVQTMLADWDSGRA